MASSPIPFISSPPAPTTFTDLPPEVLGPLLLRALPLAPACSPDLIARPCRAALAHLSAQQVADWMFEALCHTYSMPRQFDIDPSPAVTALVRLTRSDREAIAGHIMDKLCAYLPDASSREYRLSDCMRGAARKKALWLFSLAQQRLALECGADGAKHATHVQWAARFAPTPALKLAILSSASGAAFSYDSLDLTRDFCVAAGQGDVSTCCDLLHLCPRSTGHMRAEKVILCLTSAAANNHLSALAPIIDTLDSETTLAPSNVYQLGDAARRVQSQAGTEACLQQLLVPFTSKLSQQSAAQVVRHLLKRLQPLSPAGEAAVLALLPPGDGAGKALILNMLEGDRQSHHALQCVLSLIAVLVSCIAAWLVCT